MRNKGLFALIMAFLVSGAIASAVAESPVTAPLGDDEILRRVQAAPPGGIGSGVDAFVLFEGIYVSYRDGKAEVRHQRLTRIDTEFGMDYLGDPRLSHDRSRQALIVHAGRTYLGGGKVVDIPENGFNDVTPDGIDRSVDHIDIREMVVTHTGLEPGVTILLDWTVRDTVASAFPYQARISPYGEFPALEKVVVAEGLHGETVNPPDALYELPEPRKEARKFVWHVKNLAAGPRPAGPNEGDELPWIALSSVEDWNAVILPLSRNLEASVAERKGLAAALDKLEKERPFLGDREAIAGWAKMAGDRTTLVEYDPWRFLLETRTVEKVLARSTATPLERCALLLACCAEEGIHADAVFPGRWRTLPDRVPALEALGAPMLRVVDSRGDAWWADPTAATVSARPLFGSGLEYFIIKDRNVSRLRTPVDANRVEISIYWDLVSGEAACEGLLEGPAVLDLDREHPESMLEDWMNGWSDSAKTEETSVSASEPDRIRFSGKVKAPLPDADDRGRVAVTLPLGPVGLRALLPAVGNLAHSASERVLFSPGPADIRFIWKVRVPEDRTILPFAGLEEECPGGKLSLRRNGDGSRIEAEYTLLWDGRAVGPDAFREFRAFLQKALDEKATRIVLGAKKEES